MSATAALARRRAPARGGGLALRAAVVLYVLFVVALPLAALVATGAQGGLAGLREAFTAPGTADALLLTAWTGLVVALVNAVLGTVTAWVLVRYRFPGRALLSALVDLPFAIPTLVAGVMLVLLFGPDRLLGEWLGTRGIEVLFTPSIIVLALLFITVPFVVRAVEPVLAEADAAEEEAAHTLGAGRWMTFRRVILPPLVPAVLYGTLQSYARALAEFGSIVVVSGNIPHRTLTASVLLYGEVEGGRPESAAAISLVLMAFSLALSGAARLMRGARRAA
jgi:sulfate transport system permease protein